MEKRITTSSGIPIYAYPNMDQGSFFISMYVRAGSMHEVESGITHFFEHIAIRNINYRMGGELYRLLDKHGLEFNASTSNDLVQFYVAGAAEHFALGAEIITHMLSSVSLPSSEVDRERDRIRAEIREVDERSTLAGFTASKVWGGTTLERPITGTLGSVSHIGVRALERFRQETMVAENIFFYLTGRVSDADAERLASLIEGYEVPHGSFNDNLAPVPEKFGRRGAEIFIKGADFTKLRFNFDVDMTECTLPELDLLYEQLLGGYSSEFFLELSEKRGYVYDLSGSVERYKNVGSFYFSYELKDTRATDAVRLTVDILKRFKEELIPEDRFMRASYVDNAMMLYDDSRELNFTFAYDNHIMGCGYESLEARRAAYEAVTPERILALANRIFTPENLTLTMKGKRARVDLEKIGEIIKEL